MNGCPLPVCYTVLSNAVTSKLPDMENMPQPADQAYFEGYRVRVYLSDDDLDAKYYGLVCEVVEDQPDDLDKLTNREVDSHHYQLRRTDTDEVLPVWFRHADTVPLTEWPKRE